MRRAVRQSKRGYPAPNPHVGCVIVRDGMIVGEGYHDHCGGPHAEIVALRQAGERARGADVYVTLEPCNHTGRTGPCSEALIAAGVGSVTAAVADPNPKAAGGAERLRGAGIEVSMGLLARQAEEINRVFLTAQRRRRPYVMLKAAITLDGFLARPDGSSKWITGPRARREGHRLRAQCGAVLVGRRTVEVDDPQLTARLPGIVNQPIRVVLDPHSRLTGDEQVFSQPGETWRLKNAGTIEELLQELWDRGLRGVLVEGGAETYRRFLISGLVDELHLFIAPTMFGRGMPWIAAPGAAMERLSLVRACRLGPDAHLVWRRLPG